MNFNTIKGFSAILLILLFSQCNENVDNKNEQELITKDTTEIGIASQKIKDSPENAELFYARAEIFREEGNEMQAIKDINSAIALDSLNSVYYIKLAEYNLLLGKSGKTKDALEKCLSFDPDNIDATLKLAELHLLVMQYNESMELLNKVQRLDPLNAKTYFIKSLIYKEKENIDLAIENMQISLEKDPNQYSAYLMLGRMYYDLGDSIALDYFRNASKIDPQSIETYYNIAKFYQDFGEPLKAIDEYNYLISEIDSTYYFAHFNIGYIYLEMLKDYPLAINYFSKVLEMDTVYVQAIHNRGLAYELSGQYIEARDDYNNALRLVHNYKLSIDGLNRLDSINSKINKR